LENPPLEVEPADLNAEERADEQGLRERAAAAGCALPVDRLTDDLGLRPFELEAVLLCVAPEVDRSFERVYALVLDDLNRLQACIELLATLTARSLDESLAHRATLGRAGKLRRLGLLVPAGEAASDLRQELRASAALLDFLLGGAGDPACLSRDPDEVTGEPPLLPSTVPAARVARIGRALRDGSVLAVGVWGPRHSGVEEVVRALALAADLPLRRLPELDPRTAAEDMARRLRQAGELAVACGALDWLPTDPLADGAGESLREQVASALASFPAPVIVSGARPFRPTALLERRAFTELVLPAPHYGARRALWAAALPEVPPPCCADVAARFRMGPAEV